MGVTRKKPVTEREVEIALYKAKQRAATASTSDQVLSSDQQTTLNDAYTAFAALVQAKVSKKYAQVIATSATESAKKKAKNFVSAYFQSLNIGITLLDAFPKECRVLYGLAENDGKVPYLGGESDILFWGGKVATGDAARVAAGGTAMSNPTASDVAGKLGDFNGKNNNQANKKIDSQNAQADLTAGMPDGIANVIKVWDLAETFYDALPIASRRAKCREWGEVFESTEKVTINIVVKNKVNGALLAGAVTVLMESGTEMTSDAAGAETFVTNIAFGVTFETVLDNFVTNQTPLEYTTGVTVYNLVIEMQPV